jgi:putative CocE/NonD family hydrolase
MHEMGVRRVAGACAVGVLLVAASPARAAFEALPPAQYPSYVTRETYIPMSDGVQLAGHISFPSYDGKTAVPGRFPTLLTMTPYGKGDEPVFAQRGFVHMDVDIRGAGGSQGNLNGNYFSPREQRDGYELVEWLARQPFSTGRVGMVGGSYLGITQYLAAEQQPPHLAAIVPQVAASDIYREATYHGGILSQEFGTEYLAVQGGPGLVGANKDPALTPQLAQAKFDQALSQPIAFDYLANTTDTAFFHERSPIYRVDRIQVPTLVEDGWFDGFIRGASEMYPALAARRGTETALFVNPCTHKGCSDTFEPNGYQKTHTLISSTTLALQFLDRWVKRDTSGPLPAVTFYLMGRDTYQHAAAWPPPETQFERLYLRPGAGMGQAGAIDAQPGAAAQANYFTNPAAGYSVTFDRHGTVAATPYMPLDQNQERDQGLIFETGPLTRPLALVGPLSMHLVAASTATDTDWFVRISDVAPDGTATLLTEGFLRASHRSLDPVRSTPQRPYHPHLSPTPITAGQFIPYEIEVWPTANEFEPGHRLRVQLTSNDTPNHMPGTLQVSRSDPSQNRFEPLAPATNTVRFGGAEGTSLLVPVYAGRNGAVAPPLTPAPACRSARRVVLHLWRLRGRRLVSATVLVNGRRARALHGRRLRAVDLGGLPPGQVNVVVIGRTRSGRRVIGRRTYQTCVAGQPRRSRGRGRRTRR